MEKKNELAEKLLLSKKSGFDALPEAEIRAANEFAEGYKAIMKAAKTEREFVKELIKLAEARGFHEHKPGEPVKHGDKIYRVNRGKALHLAVVGSESPETGMSVFAAHIDSPRLDLKPAPLTEEGGVAYFKTHYYGGVKKYQWVTIPLELRGVVALESGELVSVCVGADENDPIFTISDLLPHLAADQMKKSLAEGVAGEALTAIVGTRPYADKEASDRVKLEVMRLLNEKYGVTEADLQSAELCFVPAFQPRDLGFDRSLIAAYGHDDRVCAYPCAQAVLEAESPKKTLVCTLADKEEVGSMGVSGMQSADFDLLVEDICLSLGARPSICMANSFCLSADVSNAFDPCYPEVSDKPNNSRLNYGAAICKYTGARGKSGSSDASAEVMARLRAAFSKNGVLWQTAELGKVDQGGGGTVAQFMANRNIDTVDLGVPVLSMHAPYEAVSKLDLYMTYKAAAAFCRE